MATTNGDYQVIKHFTFVRLYVQQQQVSNFFRNFPYLNVLQTKIAKAWDLEEQLFFGITFK